MARRINFELAPSFLELKFKILRIVLIKLTYFVFDRASLIDLNGVDYLQMFDYYFDQVKDVLEIEIGVYHGVLGAVVAMSAVFGDFWKSFKFLLQILIGISDTILKFDLTLKMTLKLGQ